MRKKKRRKDRKIGREKRNKRRNDRSLSFYLSIIEMSMVIVNRLLRKNCTNDESTTKYSITSNGSHQSTGLERDRERERERERDEKMNITTISSLVRTDRPN
eukprot:sb/3478402/